MAFGQWGETPIRRAVSALDGARHHLDSGASDHELDVQKADKLERRASTASGYWPRPSRLRSLRKVAESGFDNWMSNARETAVGQRRVTQELESEKQQRIQSGVEDTPMLQSGGKRAALRVVRDLSEVRRIFGNFDEGQSGVVEPKEFLPLLSRLLRQPVSEMDKTQVWKEWDELDTDGNGRVTYTQFEVWYIKTFKIEHSPDFTEFLSKDAVPEESKRIREFSKNFGADILDVEKVWKEFKRLDEDQSGTLEREEFAVLIQRQLAPGGGAGGASEVAPRVIDKFWMEVDADGDGVVSFEEFAAWYMRCFLGGTSPMENYYQKLGKGFRSGIFAKDNSDLLSGDRQAAQAPRPRLTLLAPPSFHAH